MANPAHLRHKKLEKHKRFNQRLNFSPCFWPERKHVYIAITEQYLLYRPHIQLWVESKYVFPQTIEKRHPVQPQVVILMLLFAPNVPT